MAFDQTRLDDLRRRYADAGGGDMHDPHFRAVAASVFKDGDRRTWPFADPATLLDAGFIEGGLTPGTPEVGGLLQREALQILRGLAGIEIVGGNVVEIAPQYDPTTNTAQVAAQVLFELLCLVALKR